MGFVLPSMRNAGLAAGGAAMKWYEIHDNQIKLVRYLRAVKAYDAAQLEQVVARWWRWEKEFNEARRWAAKRDVLTRSPR